MQKQTENSVEDISGIYMEEVSFQIQQKFSSITDLRLEQVNGIIKRTDPQNISYEQLIDELKFSTQVRDFTYMGLYTEEGEQERIIGRKLRISEYDRLLQSVQDNGSGIAVAEDSKGEKYLMLAKAAQYELKDGSHSLALIGGVPMDYLKDALFLDEKNARVYFHVIAKDGAFVIRSNDAYRDNYFNRAAALFEEIHGKTADDFISELQEALYDNRRYTTLVSVGGEHRFVLYADFR